MKLRISNKIIQQTSPFAKIHPLASFSCGVFFRGFFEIKAIRSIFHFIISPPAAKEIDKSCFHIHSPTEEICPSSLVVENIQLLSDLLLMARKNKEFFGGFSPTAAKYASGKRA
jgi:hypothetical protein